MTTRTQRLLRRERMDITIPTLIELFVTTKQTEGKSHHTIIWYRNRLSRYANFLGNGSDAKLKHLTIDPAREFIADLQGQPTRYSNHPLRPERDGGPSASTIHGYVRAMKAFSGWLYEDGFTSHNVLKRLKKPKVPKPVIEILTDQEIALIMDAINPNSFLGSRLQVIILLLLDTGIRASELCGLTLENTHLKQDYIKVLGKGNKEHFLRQDIVTRSWH